MAAKEILKAAAKGKLEVHVIRTSHVLGEPTAAVLEQSVRCSDDAARFAQAAIDDVARVATQGVDDAIRATDNVARTAAKGSAVVKGAAKLMVPVAVVVDAGFRVRDGTEQAPNTPAKTWVSELGAADSGASRGTVGITADRRQLRVVAHRENSSEGTALPKNRDTGYDEGGRNAGSDNRLQRVIDAWDKLPEPMRIAIITLAGTEER